MKITPEILGTYIGEGLVVAAVIWLIWLLIKYRPVELLLRRWQNVKYLIKQLLLVYSDQKSIFSKKRLESGIAFFLAMGILTSYAWRERNKLGPLDLLIIVGPILLVAGYNIRELQNEKKMNVKSETIDSENKV